MLLIQRLSACVAMVLTLAGATWAQEPAAAATKTRHPSFGVATHLNWNDRGWDYRKVIPMIADAGFGWIRDDVSWGRIETQKGVYVIPEHTLAWIRMAKEYDLKIILVLNYGNSRYENRYDVDAYARFCAEMARQLKGQVDAFEILNEPFNFGFVKVYPGTWNGLEADGSDSVWIGKYVELINKAAPAIKQVAPEIKVIGLGSSSPANHRKLKLGIAPEVDGIVDHPYSMKTPPEVVPFAASEGILKRDGIAVADRRGTFVSLMQNYRALAKETKGPKELWLTEWGYSNFQPAKPQLFAGFNETAQAKYTLRRFVECLGLGIEASIVYEFKNEGGNPHELEQNFGLVDAQLRPKPVYDAVSRLTRATADLRPNSSTQVKVFPSGDRADVWPVTWDGSKLAATGEIPAYSFTNSKGQRVIALWSAERANGDLSPRLADVEITVASQVTKITSLDLMTGKTSEPRFKSVPQGIRLEKFTVPDYPLLLTIE